LFLGVVGTGGDANHLKGSYVHNFGLQRILRQQGAQQKSRDRQGHADLKSATHGKGL
jgi:hypothetical protein